LLLLLLLLLLLATADYHNSLLHPAAASHGANALMSGPFCPAPQQDAHTSY